MGYKVDFDALDTFYGSVCKRSDSWIEELNNIKKNFEILMNSSNMSGTAADSIRSYIQCIHIPLINSFSQLILNLHYTNCILYRDDYRSNVDTGLQHTLIKEEVLCDCKDRIDITKNLTVKIDDNVVYVLNSISDIFQIAHPDPSEVDFQHTCVSKFIVELDEKIKALENYHYDNDFINSNEMISIITAFIREQLSATRDYRTNFNIGMFYSSQTFGDLYNISLKVEDEYKDKIAAIETAIKNDEQRIKDIEQAKKDREWVEWIAVGVAAIGSITLLVVTAGTAAPLVCAAVGMGVGITTAAANNFAENYVENGSFTEGMDWSDFTKDCVIGAATGFVSGYAAGASTVGSAIKQPITNAIKSAGTEMLEEAAGGFIDTTWEVGEAIHAGKPIDEIVSIGEEKTIVMFKSIFTSGAKSFVGELIGGKFDIDPKEKGALQKIGENFCEEMGEDLAEKGADAIWDIGCAGRSSESLGTVLKTEVDEFISGVSGDFAENSIKSVIGGINDNYNDSHKDRDSAVKEVVNDIFADTVADTGGKVAESVTKQYTEKALGKRDSVDFNEIWEEELKGGKEIAKSAVESAGKHINDKLREEDKFINSMKKKADSNGNVEVVVFDKYAVLKEDYEAARDVSKKGAYKSMSTQDILGLPKNTAVSEKNVVYKTVSVDEIVKSDYKGRKTTNVTRIDFKKK